MRIGCCTLSSEVSSLGPPPFGVLPITFSRLSWCVRGTDLCHPFVFCCLQQLNGASLVSDWLSPCVAGQTQLLWVNRKTWFTSKKSSDYQASLYHTDPLAPGLFQLLDSVCATFAPSLLDDLLSSCATRVPSFRTSILLVPRSVDLKQNVTVLAFAWSVVDLPNGAAWRRQFRFCCVSVCSAV
jgi:hypothetical protein